MRSAKRAVVITLASAFCLAGTASAQHAQTQTHEWAYDGALGPTHWGGLKPEFATCRTGLEQSPIDITRTTKANLDSIRFDYHSSPLRIIDNGHTIQVNYAPGSSIIVGDARYELRQFHFHRPSEERINGHGSDMVVHLVHADSTGHLAVVAVLLTAGAAQPLIQTLWDHLPTEHGHEELVAGVEINAASLLPADRGYFTFPGSLTTPPCSEHVTWFVLKHPVTISSQEIQTFSRLYAHNARPTQRVNQREVLESR